MLSRMSLLLNAGLFLNAAFAASETVVLDRVAIIVGRRVVKTSDLERDLRASQFVNREPIDVSPEAKRRVAERLVVQELIRQEIMSGGYRQPSEKEADEFLRQIRQQRYGGSETEFRSALSRAGLSEDQLRQYLLWQLTALRFIEDRFRPGVLVTEEDIRAYYDTNRNELVKGNPSKNTLEALTPRIRETITGERVNQAFEEWLEQTRRRTRIAFRDEAFGDTRGTGEKR